MTTFTQQLTCRPSSTAVLVDEMDLEQSSKRQGAARCLIGTVTLLATLLVAVACATAPPRVRPSPAPPPDSAKYSPRSAAAQAACVVRELRRSDIKGRVDYAPDGRSFLVNAEDEHGIGQVYIVTTEDEDVRCLTCVQQPGGPRPERFKMQTVWHPSGDWIFMAAEREEYSPPPVLGWSRDYVEGQLQSGLWTNMFAVSADGQRWFRMTDFRSGEEGVPDGFIGPVFTPDGRRAVWSQIIDGNVFSYWPFGRWELILADFEDVNGRPRFTNSHNITPAGMHWNEPGNFHPDGVSLVLSGSTERDAQGMDQFVLNVDTGELDNLTRSPTVWDEHGVFSPDGDKIIFMSAYPYRADPTSSEILSIRTEFMLMNSDGSDLSQLTRFREPGSPEYSDRGGIAADADWSSDGRSVRLTRLFFPDYEHWEIVFDGPCGRSHD